MKNNLSWLGTVLLIITLNFILHLVQITLSVL